MNNNNIFNHLITFGKKGNNEVNKKTKEEELYYFIMENNNVYLKNRDIRIEKLGYTLEDMKSEIFLRIVKYYPDYENEKQFRVRKIVQTFNGIVRDRIRELNGANLYDIGENDGNDIVAIQGKLNTLEDDTMLEIYNSQFIKQEIKEKFNLNEDEVEGVIDYIINKNNNITKRSKDIKRIKKSIDNIEKYIKNLIG